MNNKHTPQSLHAKQQECSAKDSESVPKQLDELQTVNNEAIYVSYKESHTSCHALIKATSCMFVC